MRSLINIKETVNMQMRYLIIEIFILKSQGYWKKIYLVNKGLDDKTIWNACITCNWEKREYVHINKF